MKLELLNPKHYYNEFKRFSKFVITPTHSSHNELSIAQKLTGTWRMLVVKMVLAIIIGVAIGLFYDPVNKTTISMAERFPPAVLLVVTVFILPLLEEVGFRLSLKFKPIYLALTLAVLGYYIASKAFYHVKLSDVYNHFESRAVIAFVIMVVTYPLFSIPKIKRALALFWKYNFRWLLYFFCFGFAWIHIFNYELTLKHLLLMPVITLPKLANALCYGYVRINYGFIYSFGIHMCTNAVGFVVNMVSGSD